MQNMLVMRFANRFLGPMWNAVHISNIQVSLKPICTHPLTQPAYRPETVPCQHPNVCSCVVAPASESNASADEQISVHATMCIKGRACAELHRSVAKQTNTCYLQCPGRFRLTVIKPVAVRALRTMSCF